MKTIIAIEDCSDDHTVGANNITMMPTVMCFQYNYRGELFQDGSKVKESNDDYNSGDNDGDTQVQTTT